MKIIPYRRYKFSLPFWACWLKAVKFKLSCLWKESLNPQRSQKGAGFKVGELIVVLVLKWVLLLFLLKIKLLLEYSFISRRRDFFFYWIYVNNYATVKIRMLKFRMLTKYLEFWRDEMGKKSNFSIFVNKKNILRVAVGPRELKRKDFFFFNLEK